MSDPGDSVPLADVIYDSRKDEFFPTWGGTGGSP